MLESLLNKVAGLKACIFIKKRLQHRCFPVNIAKFLRTPILKKDLILVASGHISIVISIVSAPFIYRKIVVRLVEMTYD